MTTVAVFECDICGDIKQDRSSVLGFRFARSRGLFENPEIISRHSCRHCAPGVGEEWENRVQEIRLSDPLEIQIHGGNDVPDHVRELVEELAP